MPFDPTEHPLAPPPKHGLTFPIHVIAQHARRLVARLPGEIAERRQPTPGTRVEQLAAPAPHLHAPDERPYRRATEKAQRRQTGRSSHHRISRRAVSACAIVTPSAYSRSPPTGSPRAMRDTITGVADASWRWT